MEKYLLYLLIILLPFSFGFRTAYFHGYSPTIYIWDILVLIQIILFLKKKGRINRDALNIWFIFVISQAISLLPHLQSEPEYLLRGLIRMQQYLTCGLLGVYLASLNMPLKEILKMLALFTLSLGLYLAVNLSFNLSNNPPVLVLFLEYQYFYITNNLSFAKEQEAWNKFLENPLFGVGLNNFLGNNSLTLYTAILVEVGLIGFLGFLGFTFFSLRESLKSYKFLFIWMTVIFLGFFSSMFITNYLGIRILFFIWGLSARMNLPQSR